MAQHFWLAQRALFLQDTCFALEIPAGDHHPASAAPVLDDDAQKQLALYLRYQSTHDRAFHKCADELRKLRNEKRKAEIGFSSQKRHEADAARKEASENRKQECNQWNVWLAEAKVTHQQVLTEGARLPITMAQIAKEDRKRAA